MGSALKLDGLTRLAAVASPTPLRGLVAIARRAQEAQRALAPASTPRRVLSYGGGLDSFAMLLDGIARGELPEVCVFADVGDPAGVDPAEWPGTYRHIEEVVKPLCAVHGIEWVTLDTSSYPVRGSRSLFVWLEERHQIPVTGPTRICTIVAKVERFERWMDDRFPDEDVEVWVGFDAGEEGRADYDPNAGKKRAVKPGQARRHNRFPLIMDFAQGGPHSQAQQDRSVANTLKTSARRASSGDLHDSRSQRAEHLAGATGRSSPQTSQTQEEGRARARPRASRPSRRAYAGEAAGLQQGTAGRPRRPTGGWESAQAPRSAP